MFAEIVTLCTLASAAPQPPGLADERMQLDSETSELLPASESLPSLIDQTAPGTLWLLEESGGFSNIDAPKLSILGDSWLWTRHLVDGYDITHPLVDGAPLFSLPMARVRALQIRNLKTHAGDGAGGLTLLTHDHQKQLARFSFTKGGLLGITPGSRALMDAISGEHATERRVVPPENRRQLNETYRLTVSGQEETLFGHSNYAMALEGGRRQFNQFAPGTANFVGSYPEDFVSVYLGASFFKNKSGPRSDLHLEYKRRNHLGAELFLEREETQTLDSFSLFFGRRTPLTHWGLFYGLRSTRQNLRDFDKDLIDPNGEALMPFSPDATEQTAGILGSFQYGLFYAKGRHALASISPKVTGHTHALLHGDQALGSLSYESRSSTRLAGRSRAGVQNAEDLSPRATLSQNLFVGHDYALNQTGRNTLSFVDWGADLTFNYTTKANSRLTLSLFREPIAPTRQLADALDPNHRNGQVFSSDDALLYNFGGAHLETSSDLQQTSVLGGSITWSQALGAAWQFSVRGDLKSFRETYQIRLAGSPEQYGRFTDDELFYFEDGPTQYTLKNEEADPATFTAAHFQFSKSTRRFLFSFVLSIYSSIGRAPFGSGILANDIGLVDYFSAHPNAQTRDIANLDVDRAFLTKMLIVYKVSDKTSLSLTMRHRDGQPFSFFQDRVEQGQLLRRYKSRRGSPGQFSRPLLGPREDFHLNVDVAATQDFSFLSRDWRASLSVTNLLDMGNEIAERFNEQGVDGRAALELQIPRTAILSLSDLN